MLRRTLLQWTLVHLLFLSAFAAIGATAGALSTGSRSAQAACASAPRSATPISSQYDGGWNTGFGVNLGGIYAQIQKDPPYVASGSRVSDWVMLANITLGALAQIGFYYDNPSGTRIFTQVYQGSTLETRFGSAASSGTYPTFTASYNNVPGKFSFQVNGTNWIPDGYGTPYTPDAFFGPRDAEIFAERHNQADQVPGGTSAYAGHYGSHLYYSGAWNDAWLTTNNNSISWQGIDPSPGNTAYTNGQTFYIWDTQCTT